jgi:hypothetical protein
MLHCIKRTRRLAANRKLMTRWGKRSIPHIFRLFGQGNEMPLFGRCKPLHAEGARA